MYRHFVLICMIGLFITGCSDESSRTQKRGAITSSLAEIPSGISAEEIVTHVKILASNEYEGRAPGSKGEELTLSYLSEAYAKLGLRPGNPNGTFVQEVPLVSSTVTNNPSLRLSTSKEQINLKYHDEFMGWTLQQIERVSVKDAPLVFVGYGIVAPEYEWDDYKGVDVSGKILIMLVGDPPLEDETMFGGRAMTYYGRWTYKFEIAAQKGAAGAIVIHKTDAAGYPWAVVSNSWSGAQFDIERPETSDRCELEAWITTDAASRIFDEAGFDLGLAYDNALSPDFKPIPFAIRASCDLHNSFRNIRSYNVVALLEGNDPALKKEVVVYTAHWDHLGLGNPVEGDSIYNGALDNATGCAATIEIARAFAAHKNKIKRSVLFINTTAEESGLLGSKHYANHPLYPLTRTIATVNIDGLNVWGQTRDVVVVGFGQSELDDYLAAAIRSHDRYIKPDTEPEKGYYYRSDHFPFAQKGVPALYADSGIEYRDKPVAWGQQMKGEYTSFRYHKPQDEYDANWDLAGAVEDLEAYFRVGMMVAGSTDWPQWNETSEFKKIREESLESTP